jgi:hypothetical protein
MRNPDCNLNPWESAQCPKLGPTFKQIVEKVAKVDSLLREWVSEPGLGEGLKMKILGILSLVSDVPPMLGDTGFDYVGTMRHHQEALEALKVPEIFMTDL